MFFFGNVYLTEQSKAAKEQAQILLHATESMQPFEDFLDSHKNMTEKNFVTCVSTGGACRSKVVQQEKT